VNLLAIDSFALIHNVRKVREIVGEGVHIWAVVKANGYGHGLELVAEAFWRGGVDGFIVTEKEDALWLMRQRYRVPVLMLHPVSGGDITTLIREGVRLAVSDIGYLDEIKRASVRESKRAIVHIEIETGMHRWGVTFDELRGVLTEVRSGKALYQLEGMFTHLHSPDDRVVSEKQINSVADFLFQLQREGSHIPYTHILASRGVLHYPDAIFNGIRVGHALYGLDPDYTLTEFGLTWKSVIGNIHRVPVGATIGYGGAYKADHALIAATIPVGYSDGYPRDVSSDAYVLVQGKPCPIVGRISMNAMTVDISRVFQSIVGEEVVLLGRQHKETILPSDIAGWAGTIDYEIVSRLSRHIPRVKVK
jgi:alanine racemase